MPIKVPSGVYDNLTLLSSRPIFLAKIKHGASIEYLSTGGDCTYDGQAYTGGTMELTSFIDAERAAIVLPALVARIGESVGNTWRGGACTLYAIPAVPSDSTPTFAAAEGLLILDGFIDASKYAGTQITVSIVNNILAGARAPDLYYDQICNHLPAAGESLEWEGEVLIIQSPAAVQAPAPLINMLDPYRPRATPPPQIKNFWNTQA